MSVFWLVLVAFVLGLIIGVLIPDYGRVEMRWPFRRHDMHYHLAAAPPMPEDPDPVPEPYDDGLPEVPKRLQCQMTESRGDRVWCNRCGQVWHKGDRVPRCDPPDA